MIKLSTEKSSASTVNRIKMTSKKLTHGTARSSACARLRESEIYPS